MSAHWSIGRILVVFVACSGFTFALYNGFQRASRYESATPMEPEGCWGQRTKSYRISPDIFVFDCNLDHKIDGAIILPYLLHVVVAETQEQADRQRQIHYKKWIERGHYQKTCPDGSTDNGSITMHKGLSYVTVCGIKPDDGKPEDETGLIPRPSSENSPDWIGRDDEYAQRLQALFDKYLPQRR